MLTLCTDRSVITLSRGALIAFDYTFTLASASDAIARVMTKLGMPNAPPEYLLPKKAVGTAVLPAEDPFSQTDGTLDGGLMFTAEHGFQRLIAHERNVLNIPAPHPLAVELYQGFRNWRDQINEQGWPLDEPTGVEEFRGAADFVLRAYLLGLRCKLLTAWTKPTVQAFLRATQICFHEADIFGSECFPRDPESPWGIKDKNTVSAFHAAADAFGMMPTMLVDDNPAVLDAADRAGIELLIAVLNPNKALQDYRAIAEKRLASGKQFLLVPDLSNVRLSLAD